MKTFTCDMCYQEKPRDEVHGNGCDEDILPDGTHIHAMPDTLWWCDACEAKESHEVRQIVLNQNGYKNYEHIRSFDCLEDATLFFLAQNVNNPQNEYVLRRCF